jgi:hypothetical protein
MRHPPETAAERSHTDARRGRQGESEINEGLVDLHCEFCSISLK